MAKHTDEHGKSTPAKSRIAKIMRGRAKYEQRKNPEDKEIIRRATKALPYAERHVAHESKRHIKQLKTGSDLARDARFRLKGMPYVVATHARIKKYGTD